MIDSLLLIGRLLLAGVFLVSGVSKLADLAGTREAARNFGVPAKLAGAVALLLPLSELAIAVALLPLASAWFGAAGALVLLALFTGAISYHLLRGNTPDCHCFGQLHSEPVSRQTLLRNFALSIPALLLIATGPSRSGPSLVAWVGNRTALELALILVSTLALLSALALGWLVLHLLQQNGRILTRLDEIEKSITSGNPLPRSGPPESGVGLPVGTVAPAFSLTSISGTEQSLASLLTTRRPLLLVFSDPGCGPCNALLPEIARWQREYRANFTTVVISRGTAEANLTKAGTTGLNNILLQSNREVATAYQVRGTPGAVVIRPEGSIASPVAQGADQIRALVTWALGEFQAQRAAANGRQRIPIQPERTARGPASTHLPAPIPAPPSIGQPAPPIDLPDLDGVRAPVNVNDDIETMLLFWNPGCGFCQQMLDDVREWERGNENPAFRLLVISTGSVEANRDMDLGSTILLDQANAVQRSYGARGTPSAILVRGGTVSSELVAGAPAIEQLFRRRVEGRPGSGAL